MRMLVLSDPRVRFFFQAEDGIRAGHVTGVQTCALPISNSIGVGLGLWEYPYHVIPFLPSFSLDAALVPVCFMLLYQWTLNHNKNIYLYSILFSYVFAFFLKLIMVIFHFIHMFNGINYFHFILFYMAYFIVSKLITNVFIWLQQKGNT